MKICNKIITQKLSNEQDFIYFCSIIKTHYGLAD